MQSVGKRNCIRKEAGQTRPFCRCLRLSRKRRKRNGPQAIARGPSFVELLCYSNSLTGSRSSRMYIGRPLLLGNVTHGSIPIA